MGAHSLDNRRSDRRTHRRIEPYAWLGAGALTLGMGAGLAAFPAVASADEGTAAGASATSTHESRSATRSPDSAPADEAQSPSRSRKLGTDRPARRHLRGRDDASTTDSAEPAQDAIDAAGPDEAPRRFSFRAHRSTAAAPADESPGGADDTPGPVSDPASPAVNTVTVSVSTSASPSVSPSAPSPTSPPSTPVRRPAPPRLMDLVAAAATRNKQSSLAAAATSPLKVITGVPLGDGAAPYHVVVSPKGDRTYVVTTTITGGGQSLPTSTITGIDNATNTPVGAGVNVGYVPVNGLATTIKPITFSPDGRRVYVTSISQGSSGAVSSKVVVLDAANGQPIGTPIALGSALGASGLVVSPDGGRLYTANGDGSISVFDLKNGNAAIGEPIFLGSSIGFGGPGADIVIATNNAQNVYVTDWAERAVYVIDAATNSVKGDPIVIDGSPVSLALSADNSRLIVNSMRFDGVGASTNQATLTVIDTATNAVIGQPIAYGGVTSGFSTTGAMVISRDGRYVYTPSVTQGTAGATSAALWKIDTTTGTATALPVLGLSVAISPDGRRLYVVTAPPNGATTGSGVGVVDTATNTDIGTVAIAGYSSLQALAISPDGSRLYVGDYTVTGTDVSTVAGELTVIDTGTSNPVTPTPTPPLLKVRLAVNTAVLRAREVVKAVVATVTRILNAVVATIRDATTGPARIETPQSTQQLWNRMKLVTDGFFNDGFYIDKITSAADGKERLIVYIGGSTLGPLNQPLFQNSVGWTQQPQYWQVQQLQAVVKSNPGIEILLVGYSQGGMDAQNLAANRDKLKLNITTVVTFGAPVVQDPPTLFSGYRIVHLEADKDPIVDWGRPGLRSKAREKNILFEGSTATSKSFWAPYNGIWVVHADNSTYRELAGTFDTSSQFADVKKQLKVFQGQYTGHYSA